MNVPARLSEVVSTWVRIRSATSLSKWALHARGRARRSPACGLTSLRLSHKHLLASTAPLALFGPAFKRKVHRHFHPHCPGLLARWHIAQAVRAFTGLDQGEFRRLVTPVWNADSRGLEALRHQQPKGFAGLFGYFLSNRQGVDAWQPIHAAPPARPRTPPARRQAWHGLHGEKHRSAHPPPLQTPAPELAPHPRRMAAPTQTTLGLARRLEHLVENPTPIPYQTQPA